MVRQLVTGVLLFPNCTKLSAITRCGYCCDENLFTTRRGVGGDHRPIPGFPPNDRKGCHGHSDGWPWWILFQTFFRHDSHRRFGALDVEFERTQQYLGLAGDA